MIGEIRDEETAATAIRAANSGNLVMEGCTLRGPPAPCKACGFKRNPYFLSSCLLGIIAQRLVRTLCSNCRVAYEHQ